MPLFCHLRHTQSRCIAILREKRRTHSNPFGEAGDPADIVKKPKANRLPCIQGMQSAFRWVNRFNTLLNAQVALYFSVEAGSLTSTFVRIQGWMQH
jgi:hypothetical protein